MRRAVDQSQVRVAIDSSLQGAVVMLLVGQQIAYCRSIDDLDALPGAVAECLHDGLPYVYENATASEIRICGALAEDEVLAKTLEHSCGLPVTLDDVRSTVGCAWRAIAPRIGSGVGRADRPWDWSGVVGLAHRTSASMALTDAANRSRREAA